uniref:Uncharacterized protein n=1 Tax=Marmota marmota marmota TaxID=9994 RepID=A0A8C5YRZ9_MARMA
RAPGPGGHCGCDTGRAPCSPVVALGRTPCSPVVALGRTPCSPVVALGRTPCSPVMALGRTPCSPVVALGGEPLPGPQWPTAFTGPCVHPTQSASVAPSPAPPLCVSDLPPPLP